jgi:hypothetical protein
MEIKTKLKEQMGGKKGRWTNKYTLNTYLHAIKLWTKANKGLYSCWGKISENIITEIKLFFFFLNNRGQGLGGGL